MLPKPPSCAGCPVEKVGVGYVPGKGPTDAEVAFVGQGPGQIEAGMGEPFVGPIGQKARDWMARASLNPHRLWIDNVCRCWLPENREPKPEERAFCTKVHLYPALARLPELKVVVAVGMPAAKSLLNNEKVTAAAVGTVERMELPID